MINLSEEDSVTAAKIVAKECDCPVLLLSSLNREGYKDGNRPTLASLRSSGEIESGHRRGMRGKERSVGCVHRPKAEYANVRLQPGWNCVDEHIS